jgi:hypothetical protein
LLVPTADAFIELTYKLVCDIMVTIFVYNLLLLCRRTTWRRKS